jgi:hypothetical protein
MAGLDDRLREALRAVGRSVSVPNPPTLDDLRAATPVDTVAGGAPRRSWLLPAVAAVVVALIATGAVVLSNLHSSTAPSSPRQMQLPVDTGPPVPADSVQFVPLGIQGTLRGTVVDGRACFSIGPTAVRMPHGYRAELGAGGTLILLNPSGARVAHVGWSVAAGAEPDNAPLRKTPASPCFKPGEAVWGLVGSVEAWRPPTESPGATEVPKTRKSTSSRS